jgi:UDP-2,3-diacylglucosamine pyrophosphatase LpxH
MDRWLAIISDLHVGEGILDDFDQELEEHLIGFLNFLANRPQPSELVVNGDFLDFAQATPWSGSELEGSTTEGIPLCFSELQSTAKFEAIRKAHPDTFAALKTFLSQRPGNRLVIMPGNHDVDFFWPAVRERFAMAICPDARSSQLHIRLSRAYRPSGYPWLWIEHGHQYDPVNAFFIGGEERWSCERPPVFTASDGTRRLYECAGTRFMIRYLNGLDARYPYVDNVKPFGRFIRIFGASALTPGWGPLDAAISVGKILAYISNTAVSRPRDLLGMETPDGATLPHPLVVWVQRASDSERNRFVTCLRERGYSLKMPIEMALERFDELERLLDFLALHSDIVQGVGEQDPALLGTGPGTLTLKAGFSANETEDLYAGAERVSAREGVTTVVMGHTHESVERMQKFTYFNTGSWTRYYRFEDKEGTAPWRLLRERSYESFPYRLRFVLVSPGNSAATIDTWCERSKS